MPGSGTTANGMAMQMHANQPADEARQQADDNANGGEGEHHRAVQGGDGIWEQGSWQSP